MAADSHGPKEPLIRRVTFGRRVANMTERSVHGSHACGHYHHCSNFLAHRTLSIEHEHKRCWYTIVAYPVCRSVRRLVGLFVRKVYCGKMADWIQMPIGVVSGVGRGMSVLDGVVIVEQKGAVLCVNLGRTIVTNGDFVA